MTAKEDRASANARINAENLAGVTTTLACGATIGMAQFLDIRVRNKAGRPVKEASVQVTSHAAPRWTVDTDEEGDAVVACNAGRWTVCASAPWHLPAPAEREGNLGAREIMIVNITLEELHFYLHVDADRDGVVDAVPQARDVVDHWTWGGNGRGAIVICNNDCDSVHEQGQATRDNADDVINGQDDQADIALFEIRAHGSALRPAQMANWTATLTIADAAQRFVRVFNGMPNGAFMLGLHAADQAATPTHGFSLHAAQEKTVYGIEALRYPGSGFDGLVRITLTISGGGPDYFTDAEMRVAPWIMPNHLDRVETVFVSNLGEDKEHEDWRSPRNKGNRQFRMLLKEALPGVVLREISDPAGLAEEDKVEDAFIQDCMEIGYTVAPVQNAGAPGLLRMEAALQTAGHSAFDDLKWLARSLLGPGFGYQEFPGASARMDDQRASVIENWGKAFGDIEADNQARLADKARILAALDVCLRRWSSVDRLTVSNMNSVNTHMSEEGRREINSFSLMLASDFHQSNALNQGGNLECTPPCRAHGHDYPFGRIYFNVCKSKKVTILNPQSGLDEEVIQEMTINPDLRSFLDQQIVQRPFTLDASWLHLGHVDEMVSFIPAPGGQLANWCLLIASPGLAYRLLDGVKPDCSILTGRTMNQKSLQSTAGQFRAGESVVLTVKNSQSQLGITAAVLKLYNEEIQKRLDGVLATMQRETGVAPDHVIQLPVIFAPKEPDFGPARLGAQALTGNLVNLLMSNNSCVMPAAFGPVEDGMDRFEKYSTEQILRKNGDLSVHYLDNWYKYHLDGGSMHCGTQTHRRPADMHAWLRDSEMWWNFRP